MFGFAYVHALWLLLLIPILFMVFSTSRLLRKKKLRKYGHKDVICHLMPDVSIYKPWIKFALQMLILAMIIICIARPRAGSKKSESSSKGIEVMICLDVSRSMNASATVDPNGISRLQRSKMLLQKLMVRLKNDKVGMVVFAGNAYSLLPITSDHSSASMFINNVSTDMVSTQGTAIGDAIDLATKSFTQDEHTQKAIVVITDGENREGDGVDAAKQAIDNGMQVNVIGVGSTSGANIPLKGGGFLTDENGNIVTTCLNEDMAKQIADVGKGIYVSATETGADDIIARQLDKLAKSDLEIVVYNKHDEQFPIFAAIALVLIIIDLFIFERKSPWLRNFNFFNKNEKFKKKS